MQNQASVIPTPARRSSRPGLLTRYRGFLLSKETITAFINATCLLVGLILSLSGQVQTGRWFYLAAAVIGGIPLFILASTAVFLHRDITAGFMATVAVIAAILVGEYSAAALVVFMFAVGDWLENLTIARADNALRELARLAPETVTVLTDGVEVILPVEQVVIGDRVRVKSGERIGVDGRVAAGSGSVNQSAITGESMPVEKTANDEVFAGTLNEVGALEIMVTRVGKDTTLGQIVKLVKEAQKTQAPVQRLANQYARTLVPVTFGIAVLVYLLTGDITRSITVLVVVCPCALVLATPTAVVAAIGNAARYGMLIKSGAAIEQVGKVDVVAFDKTGTLTNGQPVVQAVLPLDGFTADALLGLAAALEQSSEHPIGRSSVRTAQERHAAGQVVSDFAVLPGFGVSGQVEGRQVVAGSRALLCERGVIWTDAIDEQVRGLENEGQTVVPVAVDGRLCGLIALADTPRPEAQGVVAELKRIGVKEVIMITGDNPRTAARIAEKLGITRVYSEVLPQDKLKIVRELQAGGNKVAFVGDGVNDAPALAAAEIGIAMGLAGTDVALETAKIGLMADEIARIPQIIDLSRQALKTIQQNVIFSMAMNVLAVALGSLGIIGPVAGALMHEASALPVLANSARLIGYRKPSPK